jgi:hypothetical protein
MRLTSLGLYSFELQNYLKIFFVPRSLLQNIFNTSKFSKSHQKREILNFQRPLETDFVILLSKNVHKFCLVEDFDHF